VWGAQLGEEEGDSPGPVDHARVEGPLPPQKSADRLRETPVYADPQAVIHCPASAVEVQGVGCCREDVFPGLNRLPPDFKDTGGLYGKSDAPSRESDVTAGA